jgi:molybdopterin synthase catalytic subunit
MQWTDIRESHPDRWLVIEALAAHSANGHRIFDRAVVVEVCADGRAAMMRYADLHREHPHRELCFVHTSKTELEFEA